MSFTKKTQNYIVKEMKLKQYTGKYYLIQKKTVMEQLWKKTDVPHTKQIAKWQK